jgi:hypothetical protein
MDEAPQQADLDLREFLTARARGASDLRLALDTGLGFVVVVIALLWRPGGWKLLASAALCFVAFGGWGIADRELRERELSSGHSENAVRLLRVTRFFAVILGGAAAVALLVGVLGLALGTWIS